MTSIDLPAILLVLVMLVLANGAPVIAKRLLGKRFALPLDCGLLWRDGRPVFGASKTIRGIIAAIVACSLGGWVVGMGSLLGAGFAAASMAGDLASSFIKRRLGIEPSGRAVGLDQIPEALLPTLLVARTLELGALEIAIIVAAFWGGSVLLSPVFHKIGLRDRPH
jgi:hypothetical protein